MNGRRAITRDMIEAALKKGWNVTQTSRHYGFHRKSIEQAAERFGIILPLGMTWAPPPRPKLQPVAASDADKPKVRFSAGPAAIERALRQMAPQ